MTKVEWLRAAKRAIDTDDMNGALAIWECIRAKFPLEKAAYIDAASVLSEANRHEEAERILGKAPLSFLEHVDFLREWALIAHRSSDYKTAIDRWQKLNALYPDEPIGFSGLSMSLAANDEISGAESVLAIGIEHLPRSVMLMKDYAAVAVGRRDWPEAIRRWQMVYKNFPDEISGYIGLARAFLNYDQNGAAEELICEAIDLFGKYTDLLMLYAEVAEARNDFGKAVLRWAMALSCDPDNLWIAYRLEEVRKGIYSSACDREKFNLMMGFESLGEARSGLEFGSVQRSTGAEPLGLLRWSAVSLSQLVCALDNGFEGVGLPSQTDAAIAKRRGNSEYVTIDKRYGIKTHTFVATTNMTIEEFLADACSQLQYMRQRLLRELSLREKIFIYRCDGIEMPDEEAVRLHNALSRYGNNILLCVRDTDSTHVDGTLRHLGPGLLIGYVKSLFELGDEGVEKGIGLEASPGWSIICRDAMMIFHRRIRTY